MRWWDDDPWRYLDDERADDHRWARPWLHPECIDPCTALSFGACCRQPGNPLARQLSTAASALEQATSCARNELAEEIPGPRLMRRLALARTLLGRIPDRPASASEADLFQLSCLAGRVAGCLEEIRRQQGPSADTDVCRRRIELSQVAALAAERSQRLRDLALCCLRGWSLPA